MTLLEESLHGSYVTIRPDGIDYSNFDRGEFVKGLKSKLWTLDAELGIRIVDKYGKSSESLGVFRPFRRRPALTKPVSYSLELFDESIVFDENLAGNLFRFFRDLSTAELPRTESTITYEGKFKRVTVTQIREPRDWWRGIFLDLYVNGQGVVDRLAPVAERSKKVIGQAQVWKRYELVRAYVEKVEDHFQGFKDWLSKVEGEEVDASGLDDFEQLHDQEFTIAKLLFRHSSYMKPALFRDAEDYKYFLLAFKHLGVDISKVHNAVVNYREQIGALEEMIGDFNSRASKIKASSLIAGMSVPRGFRTFAENLGNSQLDQVYESVDRNGNRMRCPVTISKDIHDAGFLFLKRERWKKEDPSRQSYALIKVKVKEPEKQGELPFRNGSDEIELPNQQSFVEESLPFPI